MHSRQGKGIKLRAKVYIMGNAASRKRDSKIATSAGVGKSILYNAIFEGVPDCLIYTFHNIYSCSPTGKKNPTELKIERVFCINVGQRL